MAERIQKHLTHAFNKDGVLVHIDSVPNGIACECFCPVCKQPLVAHQGPKEVHHFAHKSDVDCPGAIETTLHLLAKKRIQEAFYNQDTFKIELEYKYRCSQIKECKFVSNDNCVEYCRQPFNLKVLYDTCEQEVRYDTIRRRSDLKISSSEHPQRPPIYIEIFVTHESEAEKLHSGNRIIEVKIEKVEDIEYICSHGFSEMHIDEFGDEEHVPTPLTSFYGFNNQELKEKKLNKPINFYRYILYKSGKFHIDKYTRNCEELEKEKSNSLLELCLHTRKYDIADVAKWMGYEQLGIRNCRLCKNYVQKYYDTRYICCLYKSLEIDPNDSKFDTTRAIECKLFCLDQKDMDFRLKDFRTWKLCLVTEFK